MVGQTDPEFGEIVARHVAQALKRARLDYQLEGKTVLELGCGQGFVAAGLEKKFPMSRIYGVELEQHYASVAHRLGRKVVRADMNELPFQTESIDLVVTCNVFDYANGVMSESIDMSKTVSEIRRVLKPGSVYVAYVDRANINEAKRGYPNLDAGFEDRSIIGIVVWVKREIEGK